MKEKIRVKNSTIDRRGVFAVSPIRSEERIVRYTGEKLTYLDAQECEDATYHYQIDMDYIIDGKNEARYVNHSCDPNCYSDVIKGDIWIIANRDIQAGEELTYNYGYDLEDALEHKCLCGKDNCVGYIADYSVWAKLKKIKKRKKE